ncbi:unnamed protein product [Nezara viridula]|uniref:Uncharacterized protein n=1 Tax=Nezara viridula TaxID=85310 RepID=A0A9P0E6G0_NEZVI|nr:unnamed protein product [Nezara viridula]
MVLTTLEYQKMFRAQIQQIRQQQLMVSLTFRSVIER